MNLITNKILFCIKIKNNHHNFNGDEMKKILILIIPIIIYVIISSCFEKNNIIPKNAIRIRILANSNRVEDQDIKLEVKENLEPYLYQLLIANENVDEAKLNIINNMDNIKNNIEHTLQNRLDYKINFGKNYFPAKEYKGITYEEGYYDSLLITLGNGLGDNWWCVLFPPLCLLEGQDYSDVEYTTFVQELINKYF